MEEFRIVRMRTIWNPKTWDAVWVAVRAHAIADSPRAPFDSWFACIYSYELCAVKCFALYSRACLPWPACAALHLFPIVLYRIGLKQPWLLCRLVLCLRRGWEMHELLGLVIHGVGLCASAAASLTDIGINLRRLFNHSIEYIRLCIISPFIHRLKIN